jgi:hypothetical protein
VCAYAIHLLIPAALLLDIVTLWSGGLLRISIPSVEAVIAAFSAAWLAIGLGVLVVRRRLALIGQLSAALLVFYTIIVGLLIVEVLLRIRHVTPPIPGLLKPSAKSTAYVEPGLLRGVSGLKTFTLNRLGFRGPVPPADRSVY